MMTALYTVNLMVAGTNNVPLFSKETIFKNEFLSGIFSGGISKYSNLMIISLVVLISKFALSTGYLKTRSGYLLRAVGDNENPVTSLAKNKGNVKILGRFHCQRTGCIKRLYFLSAAREYLRIASGTGGTICRRTCQCYV